VSHGQEKLKRCPKCRQLVKHLALFCDSCEAPLTCGRWRVGRVTRPDAGGSLYAPVRIVNNRQVEHGITPSYDECAVQRAVGRLNAGLPI
jgi:hypothetical protein